MELGASNGAPHKASMSPMVPRQPLLERGREIVLKLTLHVRGLHNEASTMGSLVSTRCLFPLLEWRALKG